MKEFKGTKGEWRVDKLGNVCGEDHPIADITMGPWGDEYPTIVISGLSLDRKATAVMERITYGEVPIEEAKANANLIACAPLLLEVALDFVEKVESGRAKSTDSYNKFKQAISKALGEQ